ncbi:hypothetical protein V1504DRAFT_460803 [Lipomyces starkeyi]
MAFVVGQNARILSSQSKDERKERILNALSAFHGNEAKKPFRLVEHTMMDEEYIGGCPVGTPAPGMGIWRARSALGNARRRRF